ncbi:transmembrane protein 135 [Zeugodacus cucurbitae]|uniref:Transmembrane protein 135 n=1 Tax=Zeugodacus cucurbitae TaxID=28588 RepID=A0A0A1WXG0_ZEUCU|nr:transmembrane protein 135 [Zeugodacus cucurbitae]XP_054085378.1 transmembrane protein 135 [Zeugodacus cucurbitae]XP_054085382.1 transmembrane protein 135 [Zeugodacus cucurbitae]XP_054085385.1 transmembrane protein 135 [Zeugodacus cucurbitae]XP_054085386.1 transmembrane protein 135 [Zeugodacus cucurbitae]XP_054085389.1 transmembrane protein 135 [Zeugodacus cucurbitae]
MTNAFSRFLTPVDCTCKHFNHPWTDSCANASAGILMGAIPYSLRIYTMVYALSLIMRHRIPNLADLKRTLLGILQSSAFLVSNSYSFIMFNCLLRKIIGRYYCATVAFIPCFLSSFASILVERPARRPLLTLYVANLATETLWHMAEIRGYVRSIPQGQALIFGISISTLLYLYRLGLHKTTCKDSLFNVLRFFAGKTEEGPIVPKAPAAPTPQQSRAPLDFRSINVLVQLYTRFLDAVKSRHPSCPHRVNCWHYALMGGLKPFVSGVGLQVALRLVMNLKKIVQMKFSVRKSIFNKETLNLGIFLGSFSFIYKSASCILRHSFGRDDPRFAIPAALLASVSFTKYPDVTVALYVMWKALQINYNLGIKEGVLPHISGFTLFLYSFCTAVLFHAGILEPKTIRPSYFKFLYAISGERINRFNLEPFNIYGQNASEQMKEVSRQLNLINKSPLPKFSLASWK